MAAGESGAAPPSGSTACASSAERRAALALLYTAVALTVLEYFWLPFRVEARLQGLPFGEEPAPSLAAGLSWAGATALGMLALPAAWVRFGQRERLGSIGFSLGGFARHAPVYFGLYLVMLPALLFAAGREDFLGTYPFVAAARADLATFLRWELGYLAQFFALEAFFRGYLLFTLERAMGRLAIFAMAVPYGMIHFHKPFLEALGAVVAGVFLGHLALRYRSFYGGALLHAAVALTMDLLAVRRAGLFG
jgi:membrane protease YdiL (CAAX protease family)